VSVWDRLQVMSHIEHRIHGNEKRLSNVATSEV